MSSVFAIINLAVLGILSCLLNKNNVNGFTFSSVPIKSGSFQPSKSSLKISSDNTNERTPLGKGSYVALVTPMSDSGDVDYDNLREILQWHVESGTNGLCILGTTGEATTLSMKERESVLKIAVEEVKGKMPILCGTGTINPNSVIEQTQQAIDLGCDGALVVTPYYVKPPQRGLIKHFTTIADMGLPVILYNVPGRTASDMSQETIAICAEHENIVGLKDATGDIDRVSQTREMCGEDFLLLSGDDATSIDFMLSGGDGCISVTANLHPSKISKIMSLCLEDKGVEGKQLNADLEMLHEKLFVESNPIVPKWALNRMGRITTPYCRPPLDILDSDYHSIVEDALRGAGLI